VIRNERLMESIDIILRIWAQDPPYDIVGKHWQVRIVDAIVPSLGVGFMAKPYQKPHPPISMSAMSPNSESVATAAKRGWDVVSANFAPESTLASHWRKYLQGCEASRREPDGRRWRVARNIIIGESDQQGLDWAMDPRGSNHYYFSYLWDVLKRANYTVVMKPDPTIADEDFGIADMIESMVVYGSARTVAEKLAAMRSRVGPFGTLLLAAMDGSGVNHERERATMQRLAEEVMPALRQMTAAG
jgi:alkanesulfonate monooxygenase SsuD/methylene tetrahydromethanopterin reductase-like flavin-dependent oxidoreductase (luciferase family)